MGATTQLKLIEDYINCYNNFDIQGMLQDYYYLLK